MEQYLPIVLMLLVAFGFAAGSFLASQILGPLRPTGAKEGPYESGIVPRAHAAVRFPVRFFVVAMIFIIFDIEVIFVYPWAVIYHQLARFGFGELAAFSVVVFISFAYLVSNGALDWGPTRKYGKTAKAQPTRTVASTVRRVPRPDELALSTGPMAISDPELAPGPTQPDPDGAPVPVAAGTASGDGGTSA